LKRDVGFFKSGLYVTRFANVEFSMGINMLEGIRVIEFEALGPAPFASMLLADLGAEVITIHRVVPADTPGNAPENLLDRGKRSIVLNLKSPDDIAIVKSLLSTSDALIEGMRPGVMERLGLGPEPVLNANPDVVYGRMTGWGQDGPLAKDAGHDLNYIGRAGALWYASNPGETPFAPPTLVGDIGGGALYLVVGMLAALLRVKNGGKGCVVDAAIVDGAAHMMSLLLSLRSSGGLKTERGQSTLDGPHWSRCYATKGGGYMSVQCIEPKFYATFLTCLELSEDQDFLRQFDKGLWPELAARLSGVFATRTSAQWDEVFGGTDACVAPVLSPEASGRDPHIAARNIWHEHQGHLQASPAPRFSDWQAVSPVTIPDKDQHRAALLKELNMREIDE
jgi:crotonobetainyl-CoA:carnitine CoA-transferase CaiB-like acyl-CoA transferase